MDRNNEERLIRCSPQRVNQLVLDELQQAGQMNSVIALHIQENLHHILNTPDYYNIRKQLRVRLRRMQGLAFDGFYPSSEERYALLNEMDDLCDSRDSQRVYGTLLNTMIQTEEFIDKNEKHWIDTGYKGDLLRIHQDLDAIVTFADHYRGRLLFFGSARKEVSKSEYDATRWLSQTLVEHLAMEDGQTEVVLTGGGPGVMEAANEGAMRARYNLLKKHGGLNGTKRLSSQQQMIINTMRRACTSIGLRIELPFETGWNPHLQINLSIKTFPNRKFGMNMSASGRNILDGKNQHITHGHHPAIFSTTPGFGTADENWEALCAMQCGKMQKIPLITVGKSASQILTSAIARMLRDGTIDPKDASFIIPCRTEVEAIKKYLDYYEIEPSAELKDVITQRKPVMH